MHGQTHIDWLAVCIAALLNMLIGYVWYSKWLFGPLWHKLSKNKPEKMHFSQPLMGLGASLVIAYFLALFASHMAVTTVADGMLLGALFWLGFVVTTQISVPIWTRGSWLLFSVDTAYKFVSYVAMAGVIGA